MNPIRAALLVPAVLLAGCDSFVAPPVACDDVTVGVDYKLTSARKGEACYFPEAVLVTVSHAPKVDQSACEEDCGDVSSLSLVGSDVRVVGGSGAVFLCPGPGASCAPSANETTVTVDEQGGVVYRALIAIAEYGLPGPGGTSSSEGVLATEFYRPGNSCPVKLKMNFECLEAPETTE